MYEGEQNTISSEADKNILRSSNYITGGCDLKENINLLTTGYFQPDMSDPADFRFILESSLNVEMSEHFTFSTALKYRYDSQPSAGLEDYDLNVTNGIKLTF